MKSEKITISMKPGQIENLDFLRHRLGYGNYAFPRTDCIRYILEVFGPMVEYIQVLQMKAGIKKSDFHGVLGHVEQWKEISDLERRKETEQIENRIIPFQKSGKRA